MSGWHEVKGVPCDPRLNDEVLAALLSSVNASTEALAEFLAVLTPIWAKSGGCLHRTATGFGFTYDLETVDHLDDISRGSTEGFLIIDYQDAHGL